MTEKKIAFDDTEAEIEASAIAQAEAEIEAGKGVPHAKVREWLLKLLEGDLVPPPCQ